MGFIDIVTGTGRAKPTREHLEILKRGVNEWNAWRKVNLHIEPNLGGANLTRANLAGVNFKRTNLEEVYLTRSNLKDADLSDAFLVRADLSYSNLTGINSKHTVFNAAILIGVDFSCTVFNGTSFQHAHLNDANFIKSHLVGVDFTAAHLNDAKLCNATLPSTYFNDTNLNGTDFTGCTIAGINLIDVDLSSTKGLDTVKHASASHIGIDTIYLSKGNIPEVFLRGCGVPENFITYMHSLTGQALEFYKCFISFTEADDSFSERLYNDLQAAGVRCWRWKEDAKWGKTLMSSIDEAVRLYDKLVVVCSEQSLNSPAVIREIERALQKEDELARKGKSGEVLFPIRLDDYIFSGWNHYRKADVVAKNVGDFRYWHKPDRYKNSLDRLLRDLKPQQ